MYTFRGFGTFPPRLPLSSYLPGRRGFSPGFCRGPDIFCSPLVSGRSLGGRPEASRRIPEFSDQLLTVSAYLTFNSVGSPQLPILRPEATKLASLSITNVK